MTDNNDNTRIHELCCLIAVEQDQKKFLHLVDELHQILEIDHQRFKDGRREDQRSKEEKGK
jgi:hypothetical protein